MFLTILFFINELLDIYLNNQSNLLNLMLSYFLRFKRSIFLFFITQFNFIFLTFCIFYLNITNSSMLGIWICYLADVFVKIYFIKKFSNGIELKKVYALKAINLTPTSRVIISFIMSICFYYSLT